MTRAGTTLLWAACVAFVVYGSLVPLAYTPVPLDDAWQQLRQLRLLRLGMESRADWLANGVLYLPLGVLTGQLAMQTLPRVPRFVSLAFAAVFAGALAVAVEFAQLYFPPRTVSLNDLLAEWIGGLAGVALAPWVLGWLRRLWRTALADRHGMRLHLLDAYVLAYLVLSLFPYDFLLSSAEVAQKAASDRWGWLLAGDAQRPLITALQLVAEGMLAVPLGAWWAIRRRSHAPPQGHRAVRAPKGVVAGALLGLMLEAAQFFIASGVSQGLSVATRALGVAGGMALWTGRHRWQVDALAARARRHAPVLTVLYLLLLAAVAGWFTRPWHGFGDAAREWQQLRLLPFYYHYYTTEARAVASLAAACLMYAPFGVLAWVHRRSPAAGASFAMIVATVLEGSRLFIDGLRPDPTNILIAGAAAWAVVRLAIVLARPAPVRADTPASAAGEGGAPGRTGPSGSGGAVAGAVAVLAAAYGVATFPVMPLGLGVLLCACAVAVWRHPPWLLVIALAAFPVLDLAPWSGRFYWDEYDMLLLAGVGIAHARTGGGGRRGAGRPDAFTLAGVLLAALWIVGTARGLLPWQAIDENAFNSYLSHYNALRIAKGALWAWLLLRLMGRWRQDGVDVEAYFARGMVIGLSLAVAVILVERAVFSGLFDLSDGYRATGLFSATHKGGGYVEAYLAAGTAFALAASLRARRTAARAAAVVLVVLAGYAMMVTYSRGGYVALAFVVAALAVFEGVGPGRPPRRRLAVLVPAAGVLVVAAAVLSGPFASQRLSQAGQDWNARAAHWRQALALREPGVATSLLGMGVGRFASTYFWASADDARPASYRLLPESDGNAFLRLGSGPALYIEQVVRPPRDEAVVLRLRLRVSTAGAPLDVSLCEKSLVTSRRCETARVPPPPVTGAWHATQVRFSTLAWTASGAKHAWRPHRLSLRNAGADGTIDVDDVSVAGEFSGAGLLRNGDFSAGLDHWFFTSDAHAAWQIDSLPATLLFDVGWLGLLAASAFAATALARGAVAAWRGDSFRAAAVAALLGILVCGLFSTLVDAPRFLMLAVLLACAVGTNAAIQRRQT